MDTPQSTASAPSISLLTLYYDGACPFCAAEIARLRHWDEASHRYRISAWLGYQPLQRCDQNLCGIDTPFLRK